MTINPDQLEQDADALIMGQPESDTPATKEESDSVVGGLSAEQSEQHDDSQETVSIERYKNAEARMHQALQEAAALRKDVEELRRQVESKTENNQSNDDRPDDLEGLMADYPEIVGPLVNKMRAMEKLLQDVQQTTGQIQETTAAQKQREHIQAIQAVHPDVIDIANSQDFQGWVARQSDVVKNAVANGSSDDVIFVLNRYKSDMGLQKSDKLEQARNVATPKVGGAKPNTQGQPKFTRESIAAMTPEEFAKHEKAIDEAMAQGLIM